MVRRAKAANGQAICGSAVKNEEGDTVGFEKISKTAFGFRCDLIGAVGNHMSYVKTANRFQGFRTNSGIVVARKLAPSCNSRHAVILRQEKKCRQRENIARCFQIIFSDRSPNISLNFIPV